MVPDPFKLVPIDRDSVQQSLLDISRKERSNLLPWTGQFSPQLVEVLLRKFAPPGSSVLDPFVGSGTVLHESARLDLGAVGVEVNPAAVLLARLYTLINEPRSVRQEAVYRLDRLIDTAAGHGPLFGAASSVSDPRSALPEWYQEAQRDADRILIGAMTTLADFYDTGLSWTTVSKKWQKLRDIVCSFPETTKPVVVRHGDARALPVTGESIDLVLTSPPYINVFNYHQKYRASVEALGWNVLSVAPSEIGSNRKHRGNRFLTVIQYCLDMARVLQECQRVTRKSGRMVFVVGRESNVRGTPFWNGRIVAQIATALDIPLLMRQERQFGNRFGQAIYEDILHFGRPGTLASDAKLDSSARSVAQAALEDAISRSPSDSRTNLEEALSAIDDVGPSPLYVIEPDSKPQGNYGIVHTARG